jgi:amino acid adenylation domain-containing protein
MGLIGAVLQPLYLGAHAVILPPVAFLQRPFRWLRAISSYRAATSGGPNFAYDLCVRKIGQEERASLDLSCWTTAFNGAEPVREETLSRFVEAFEPCGFRREAFFPCYGLAEATLMVAGSACDDMPSSCEINSEAIEASHIIEERAGQARTRTLVSCGKPLPGQRLAIVDPGSQAECPADRVGEIWVRGPSVASGYWNQPEESAKTFNCFVAKTGDGPFLRTGDLGFIKDGALFVTGRLKDLLILRGRNYYPQDIESSAESAHEALRPGCGAATSIDVDGVERLVVLYEIDRRKATDPDRIIEAVYLRIAEEHDLAAHAVCLIEKGSLPKTSSGKVQRSACRRAFLNKSLPVVAERCRGGEALPEQDTLKLKDEPASQWIAAQIAARLGVSAARIDLNEPLTAYGLDSLDSVEISYALESRFGISVPAPSLIGSASIAKLAEQAIAAADLEKIKLPPALSTAAKRLSRGEQALWFLHQVAPESGAYNISISARIAMTVDTCALKRAFHSLAERHACLRTAFPSVEGEPRREINDTVSISFEERDVSCRDDDQIKALLAEAASLPFDLARGPLFRVLVLNREKEEHFLLITAHHIIADFWSLGLLLNDLGKLYESEIEGEGPDTLPVSYSYGDHVAFEEGLLAGPEAGMLDAFWRSQLREGAPVLNLPTDRARPPAPGFDGASITFDLAPEITERVKAFARKRNTTLYATLLAVFEAMLHRYSGQESFFVGAPTISRLRKELKDVPGYFVNTLPIQADFSGDPCFGALAARTRDRLLDALKHQAYPFQLMVEGMEGGRDTGHSPVFQVMFGLQKAPAFGDQALASFALGREGATISVGRLRLESLALKKRASQLDLTLMMAELDGGMIGSFEYSTDLFDEATIERMAAHFTALLEDAVAHPERRVSELHLLTGIDRLLLEEWNPAPAPRAADCCIHHLFESQTEISPERTAVISRTESLSYRELNRRSNRLANYLLKNGVGPEMRVGVCLNRSTDMLVALLAILKAGGAYVPLDPAYPQKRLSFILDDAGATAIITEESLKPMLAESPARLICLEAEREAISMQGDENPPSSASAGNLAYMIYTSGSTGRPKGVAIEHRSAAALLFWARDTFTAYEMSGVLASTSLCFDLSVFELFAPLSCGGTVILASNALELLDLPARESVRLVNTVPSAMSELLSLEGVPASVTTINLAGEPLQKSLARRVYALCGAKRVFNLYGPSEDTTYSTFALATREGDGRVPIGRPIANSLVLLLDADMNLAPIGVPGEIYIAGEGLARCYLNRPDLTAEKFVPDPFSSRAGDRLYRTGDRARYLPDGNLDFLGRIDNQVKIRGFRIELAEVESALRNHEAVKECVASVCEDERGDKKIVAYVVPEPRKPLTEGGLRRFLREMLPEYMLPSRFMILESLPLTPNGKLNRNALVSAASPVPEERPGFQGVATPVEETLLAIWKQVLGLDSIGLEDNFYDIGGHSLLATRIASRVREAFRIEISLRTVLKSPTIRELSARINESLQASHRSPAHQIERSADDGPAPLSFAQQRLWLLNQLDPESPAYNVSFALDVGGKLNVEALCQALREFVRRHEPLRSSIRVEGSRPVQEVGDFIDFEVPIIDVSALPIDEREAAAGRLAQAEARRIFDLSRPPMVRARFLRASSEEHTLVVTVHHVAFDGWSLGIFFREIGALLESYRSGRASELVENPIRYSDFSRWQREWMGGDMLSEQLSYWKCRLADFPPLLDLPSIRQRSAIRNTRGDIYRFDISHSLTESLRGLSRREGATFFMVLMAAFKALLCRYTGQEDIIVGAPIANRHRAEIEPLAGFFSNMVAMRTDLSGDPTFSELLKRVRETSLGAYAHQDLPFERLVEEIQPERSLGRTPVFQTVLALHADPLRGVEVDGLTISSREIHTSTSKFDLQMNLWETEGGLTGTIEYSTDLFDLEIIEALARHFTRLLDAITEETGSKISALPLLSSSERLSLSSLFSSASSLPSSPSSSSPLTLHHLFQLQAAASPLSSALSFHSSSLSFSSLNSLSNKLAHLLISSGIRPGHIVALSLHRSPLLLLSILASLKAGAAFLPLDPDYPLNRISLMIGDSSPSLILTDSDSADSFKESGCDVIPVSLQWLYSLEESEEDPEVDVGPDDAAYVIYTSGSSGIPKGVVVTHANVVRLFRATEREFQFNESDVWTLFHSYAFDFSVWEMWGALIYGGRLVIVPHMVSRSPEDFLDLIVRERVTVLNQTPSAFRRLALADEAAVNTELPLRLVIFGGEPLDLQSLEGWISRHGDARPRLVNMYGITETTVHVTFREIRKRDLETRAGSVIGRPLSDLQIYLLDRHHEPAPFRTRGEIYVAGAGLARGYLNRPDLTAERFLPNPYSDEPGARLYKTGDIAMHTASGELEYVGRADNQVKVRGFRIEPGEIESNISQHPMVAECAVVAPADEDGERHLAAYFVPERGTELSERELRSFLKERLPDFMVPGWLAKLERMPLNSNGKVDRKALARLKPAQRIEVTHIAPETEMEKLIASVWQDLFRVERVGIDDNFFDLGGTSLTVVDACNRLRDALNRDIAVLDVFRYTTVRSLARHLSRNQSEMPAARPPRNVIEQRRESRQNRKQLRMKHGARPSPRKNGLAHPTA